MNHQNQYAYETEPLPTTTNPELELSADVLKMLVDAPTGNVPALRAEGIVTNSEIDYAVGSAQHVMTKLETVDSTLLNGREVRTTKLSIPHTIETEEGPQTYHIRLMQMKRGKRFDPDVYVVFDATESADYLAVRDPGLIKIESGDDAAKGIYVHQGIGNPDSLNDRDDVTFVEDVITTLVKKDAEESKVRTEAIAEAQAAKQKADEQEKANKRFHRREHLRTAGKITGTIGGISLLASSLIFAGKGISSIEHTGPREKFDKQGLTLPGGTTIHVGETASPDFSFDLLNDTRLKVGKMPEAGSDLRESPHKRGKVTSKLGNDNNDMTVDNNVLKAGTLREVIITSTKGERATEITHVQLGSLNDTLKAWTDSDPSKFTITLNKDGTVVVHRTDQETGDKDDIRVVLQYTPAPASAPVNNDAPAGPKG